DCFGHGSGRLGFVPHSLSSQEIDAAIVSNPKQPRLQRTALIVLVQLPIRFDQGLRSEEHTSELQSRFDLVCRLLLEKKNYLMLQPFMLTAVLRISASRANCRLVVTAFYVHTQRHRSQPTGFLLLFYQFLIVFLYFST